MRNAIDLAAEAAECSRTRILAEARLQKIDPEAAASAVWLAARDSEHDIDGTPILPNQRAARARDLVEWAVGRAARLDGTPTHDDGDAATTPAYTLADVYRPSEPRVWARAYCDGRCSQRTARRWQLRRKLAEEAGQESFRGFGSRAGNFGVAGGAV